MSRRRHGLVLFPGAGGDREHHALVAVAQAVAPAPVARCDFPYRIEGRRAPDRAPKLIAAIEAAAAELAASAKLRPDRLVLGGRSMGGRLCSMAVADGLPAAGLLLLSYPLHPPGKPERSRVEHLPALSVPCLFVGGTRDPFGTPAELEAATHTMPGPVTHVWLDGERHDPRTSSDAEIVTAVRDWFRAL